MHRCFLATVLLLAVTLAASAQDTVGREIAPWQPGMLDIHQISTGRGNSGLYILPDGTTLLVDAGEINPKTAHHTPDRPDGSRPAGEWIARYLRHSLRHDPQPSLDYVLLTHFHADHMGSVSEATPVSRSGAYRLAGLSTVGENLKIGTLLDRGYPDYNYPAPISDVSTKNYRAFAEWQAKNNGLKVERFAPGRNNQIVLRRDPRKYANFEVRNIGANGEVWTGVGTATRHYFPNLENVPRAEFPSENMCSVSFRLSYGSFDFFSGGDITGIPTEGYPDWHDIESPVAKATGPVEAAILNHHGWLDSMNAYFVSSLRPRVWTLSSWDAGHPTWRVWLRLQSQRLYPGPREIFVTDLHPATRQVILGMDKLASDRGHIVLRVSPGGAEYRVVIVDDSSESHLVTKIFGPYRSE